MGARYLTDLVDVLWRAGLDVTSQEGWATRARSSGGFDGDRPWCVMWHHAASAPNATTKSVADYASYGNTSTPVCNLVLGRAGDVIVCAAGATNTNGAGGPYTVSKGVIGLDTMNSHAIGIEAVNTGVGEAWPQVQIDAYFTINNALAAAYGLAPTDLCTHAVWAPSRKIDPATADAVEGAWVPQPVNSSGTWWLEDVQAEAARRATPAPQPPEPPPTEEDTMPLNFIAAAPNSATVLVAIDGAGTSVVAFMTAEDIDLIQAAIVPPPPIVHISEAQMREIMARAGAGDSS